MSNRSLKLILLRHCEDLGSQVQKFEDSRLTIKGESDAAIIGNNLINENITKIFTSPLLRTLQTARIIGNIIKLPPQPNELLRDRDVGDAIGMTYSQVQNKFSQILNKSMFDRNFQFPNGETNDEAYNRAKKFLTEIMTTPAGITESILIISHPLTLNYMLYLILGMGFQDGIFFQFEHGMACTVNKELSARNFQFQEMRKLY